MDYIPPKPPEYKDPREHKADDLQKFLRNISFLESSYGKNTDHEVMQDGQHAGTHAVGEYGLMPLTAQDIDRQSGVNQLQDIDALAAQVKLEKDPILQRRLAETYASKLLAKNPQSEAVYKWEHGPYSKATPEEMDKSERVRRFKVLTGAR